MARPARRTNKARPRRDRDPLATAVIALRERRPEQALAAMLAAWRGRPTPRLGELIETISNRAPRHPEVHGKTIAARTAWLAVAAEGKVLDRGVLLEALTHVSAKEAGQRLAIVAGWMPDPRVDAALADLMHAIPYRATSTRPFWTQLFELARGITDRRQLAVIETATADQVAVTMGDWLRARFAVLASELAESLADAPGAPDPRIDDLAALLGPPRITAGTRNLEALLQAIHENPDDDAPRLVYADALLERGDPRGELINLQLTTGDEDREARRRASELLQAHGKHWLGSLAPVVRAGYVFARGFLSECRVDNRHLDRVRKVAGHPAWATVRSISGSATIALDPVMRSLRELRFISYEARGHEELPDSWRDLLIGTPRPIEVLHYSGVESDRHWQDALEANRSVRPGIQGRWVHVPAAMELAALCSCSALPRLRELVVAESPDLVADALLGSEVIRRLQVLGFAFESRGESRPLEPFASALRDAPVPRLRFELGSFHTTHLELERGDHGYRRLTMAVGPTSTRGWSAQLVDEAIAILDAMPGSLREVEITTRRLLDRTQFARLRTAVAQMDLDASHVG